MCMHPNLFPFLFILGRRSMSVSSSRRTTPAPSQSHYNEDIDKIFYGANPYDAHGPYDDGYRAAGPSRPAPIPYDDPYADEVKADIVKYEEDSNSPSTEARLFGREPEKIVGDHRGRGRGRGRGHDRGGGARDRGRGRGRGRQRSWGESRWSQPNPTAPSMESYNTSTSIPQSPTSNEIERTINQPVGIPGYSSQPFSPSPTWNYQPGGFQGHQFGQQQQHQQQSIQPHINPRFASAFGFNGPPAWFGNRDAQFNSYQVQQPSQPWTNQWLVHGQEHGNVESDTYTPT